jgi:large repetitive protein
MLERRLTNRRLLACFVTVGTVVLLVPAAAGAASQSRQYYDAVISKGPAMYWRLDEASGSVLNDASGHGHTGTLHGGVAHGQPSGTKDADPSISLDGATGYVTADSYSPFAVGSQRTFSLLWKHDRAQSFIVNLFGGSGNSDLHFPVFETSGDQGNGFIRFRYYGDIANQFPLYDDWNFQIPVGQWLHIVLTVDQTASDVSGVKLWVDGHYEGSPTTGYGAPNPAWVKWGPQAGPFMMGTRYQGDGTPYSLEMDDATYDDVAVFERILGDAEIRNLALASGHLATGRRAAALRKCKKKHSKKARRKCKKKAKRLPV